MLSVCIRYLGDEEAAGAVLRNVFGRVLREIRKKNLGIERITYSWMKPIAIDQCLVWFKNEKAESLFPDFKGSPLDGEIPDLDAKYISEIPIEIIDSFIQQLPTGYRIVFNLHCLEHYSYAEIEKRLGLEQGTAKIHFRRAKELLARKIKAYSILESLSPKK